LETNQWKEVHLNTFQVLQQQEERKAIVNVSLEERWKNRLYGPLELQGLLPDHDQACERQSSI
jgi:hypothetical protein